MGQERVRLYCKESVKLWDGQRRVMIGKKWRRTCTDMTQHDTVLRTPTWSLGSWNAQLFFFITTTWPDTKKYTKLSEIMLKHKHNTTPKHVVLAVIDSLEMFWTTSCSMRLIAETLKVLSTPKTSVNHWSADHKPGPDAPCTPRGIFVPINGLYPIFSSHIRRKYVRVHRTPRYM